VSEPADAVDGAATAEAEEPAAPRPRSYRAALVSLALGAALLLLASGRTWATLVVADPGLPSLTVAISGSELTYGSPLALLALAGIAGLVALRRLGRIIAGAVLLLCAVPAGISVLVFGLTHGSSLGAGDWIAAIAGEKAGVPVDGSTAAVSWWWVVELVGVLLVGLAGALAVVASAGWPQLGRRYEREGSPTGGPRASASTAAPASAWDELDAGVDPTLDRALDEPPGTAPPPDDDPNRAT
jgi:uncharacterized membrane protein (TIGR02234 family)